MKKVFTKLITLITCISLTIGSFIMVGNLTTKVAYADEPTPQTTEKIADVYLVAGQSNAEGCSLITGGKGPVYETQPNLSFADASLRYDNVLYNHNVLLNLSGGAYKITDFIPVVQGLGWNSQKTHIGPELGMAQYLDPIYAQKENTDAIIIKVAAGGTSLVRHYDTAQVDLGYIEEISKVDASAGTWYPESLWNVLYEDGNEADLWSSLHYRHPTGYLYRELISFIKNNYQWLQNKGYTKINFKALCWMQGESDYGSQDYAEVLKVFTNDVRYRVSEVTGEDYSSLPIIIGELGATYPSRSLFVDMQRKIPQALNNSYVIGTEKFALSEMGTDGKTVILGSDGAHWNYPDMVEVGKMFGEEAYKSDPNDSWLFFETSAKRNDHMDKTTIENVKLDIDEFNENGKLSLSCDLKKLYDITSLKIKDGVDLTPYLTQTVDGDVRKYVLDGVSVDNSSDIVLQAHFENAKTYNVSVSIAEDGKGYGDKIYTYEQKVYTAAGGYTLETHPADDGRVYKVTVNGIEVEGAKNKKTIVIDDIFDYLNGEDSFKIMVQYSAIPKPRIEASGYIATYERGEAFSTDGLKVNFYDSLDNVTPVEDYEVDSSRFDSSKVGTYLITITSGDYTCTYTVNVVAPTIEVENAKSVFLIGEKFSIGDADIYLVTKAGRTKLEQGQYTVTTALFNPDYAGTYSIIVSSNGASGTYTVSVVVPDSITVENAKTEFTGEEFTTGDIVVKAVVGSETIVLDESQYTVSVNDFNKSKSGTYTVTVTACGKSVEYDVTVTVAAAGGGCGANAMEIISLIAGLCAVAFVFKKAK